MTTTGSADIALGRDAIGRGQFPDFHTSRRDNETIITYLERLCDEYNATDQARN